MANVLLVTQFFPPETNAAANRVAPIADALARRHRLTVLTLRPGYPSPDLYDAETTIAADRGRPYRIRRTFAFRPHTRSLPARALREQLMALRLVARGLRDRPDLVLVSTPSMFLAPAAWLLARATSAPLVWDVRDVTWRLAGALGVARGPVALALRLVDRLMWAVLRRAELVVAATPGIADVLEREGVSSERIFTLANTISSDLREALGDGAEPEGGERVTVAYAGLIGYSQGLEVLLSVAGDLPDVDFVLAGDGPQRAEIERRARDLALANVRFTGYLGRPETVDLYRTSDVLFVQTEDTPYTNEVVIPIKLYEYMAAGRPVVYAGRGLAVRMLEEIGCAEVVPPRDSAAIAAAIGGLARDAGRRRLLGERGRAHVASSPSREELAEGLVDEVERLLARPSGRRG